MKKLLPFLLFTFVSFISNAQDWNHQYVNTLGGSDGSEDPVEMIVDQNNNLLHAGHFMSSSITIGSKTIDHRLPGMEYSNAYFASFSVEGNLNWAKGLTGSGGLEIQFLENAPNNTNFLFGRFSADTLYYDGSYLMSDTIYDKFYLMNVQTDGTLSFAEKILPMGGSPYLSTLDVKVGPNSNFYFTGSFSGDSLKISDQAVLPGNDSSNNQVIMGKFDPAGNLLWSFTDTVLDANYSGTSFNGMDVNSSGQVIAGGILENGITSVIGGDTLMNMGENDLLLAKFDAAGVPMWVKHMGSASREEILDVEMDASNNIYIYGKFYGNTLSIDGEQLANDTSGVYAAQFFIAKFNASGAIQWMKKVGVADSFDDDTWSIHADSSHLYLTSSFVDSTLSMDGITLENHGGHDLLVTKLDTSGTALWANNFGGSGRDDAFDIAWKGNYLLLTGDLNGTMIFNSDTINSTSSYGIYTAQVDLYSGNVMAVKVDSAQNASYSSDFSVDHIAVDQQGGIYSGGTFGISGITLDGETLNQFGGSSDVYIAKRSRIYSISGGIYDYSEQPVTEGMVYLYEYALPGPFRAVDSVAIDNNARYSFEGIAEGKYLVKAQPDSGQYPALASTYYTDAILWNDAMVIDLSEGSNNYASIFLRDKPVTQGAARICGEITLEETKRTKGATDIEEIMGKPVKSASVILRGKEKALGDFYAITKTNARGIYCFENVERGLYEILVDFPGADQTESYEVEVNDENAEDTLDNFDYIIEGDSIVINDSNSATSIDERAGVSKIQLYPNPVKEALFIESDGNARILQVDIYSLNGRMIRSMSTEGLQRIELNVDGLRKGIYLLRIRTDDSELSRKMIVQ